MENREKGSELWGFDPFFYGMYGGERAVGFAAGRLHSPPVWLRLDGRGLWDVANYRPRPMWDVHMYMGDGMGFVARDLVRARRGDARALPLTRQGT